MVNRKTKKCVIMLLLFAFILTSCGKEDTVGATTPISESAAESDVKPEETGDKQENTDEHLENEFFRVTLKTWEQKEVDDGYGNVKDTLTIVFEFENITNQTYYKQDEEILPGACWEKKIVDSVERWKEYAGGRNWIHYRLFDTEQNEIFAGGLCFEMDEELNVINMEIFAE
ncbi:MAG: hypothetical protein ACI4HQ_09130 [Acetatifactor sp.]